jgi:hypothetical protein
MAEMGGYRKPSMPAPVSGPGRLSRRTDGTPQQTTQRMTGMGYGENADYNDIQSSAPLAATPPLSRESRSRGTRQPQPGPQAMPVMAPTTRPMEPVTAGASFGPGRTVSPVQQQLIDNAARRPSVTDSLSKLSVYDRSGRLQNIVNYFRSVE